MGESELIGACQQHLRNAELHLRSNNPKAYAASMSSVRELLTKELVGDAPPTPPTPPTPAAPPAPSPERPGGGYEPSQDVSKVKEFDLAGAKGENQQGDVTKQQADDSEADKNATAKGQEVAAEAHKLYGPLISSPEAEAKAEAEQADSE